MTGFAEAVAGRAHRATEVLHALIYFVPEADEEFTAVGLRPGRMGYFASRSAPMGAVPATVTAATFYNFNPDLVARHIPRAWTLADPDAIVAARLRAADRALQRLLPWTEHGDAIAELAGLAREACTALPLDGRPLFAGHAQLPWPDEPVQVMWHASGLLREYRGDGHIAALVLAELSGLEAIVTHTATQRGFTEAAAKHLRGWSDEQWADAVEGLRGRGLLAADGALTAAGTVLRQEVEAQTDRLDQAAWKHLGEPRTARLVELGKQLSRAALAAGAIPPGVFTAGH